MTERNPTVVAVASRSDVGKVRDENQDSSTMGMSPSPLLVRERGRLVVVADGMGGQRAGALASKTATAVVKREYYQSSHSDPRQALGAAVQVANREIFEMSQSDPYLEGMGTTCSALVLKDGMAYIAHVGDSRIYLVRGGSITRLTEDHSVARALLKAGVLSSEQAERVPRNMLERAVGPRPDLEVDTPEPFELEAGDVFVLCSDGLHGVVRDEEILRYSAGPVDEVVDQLVDLALDRGGPDNVTVVVARVQEA